MSLVASLRGAERTKMVVIVIVRSFRTARKPPPLLVTSLASRSHDNCLTVLTRAQMEAHAGPEIVEKWENVRPPRNRGGGGACTGAPGSGGASCGEVDVEAACNETGLTAVATGMWFDTNCRAFQAFGYAPGIALLAAQVVRAWRRHCCGRLEWGTRFALVQYGLQSGRGG